MSAPRGGYRRPVKRSASKDADRASKRAADNNHNEHWNSERYKMIQAAALSASALPRGPTGSAPARGLKRLNPFSAEAERARKVLKEEPKSAISALSEQTAPHSGAFGGFKFAGKNANVTGTFGKPSLVFPSQPSAYREPTPTAFAPAHMALRGGRDVGVTSLETPERHLLPAELAQPTKALAPRPETYARQRISALLRRADGKAWIAVTPAEPGKAEWWPAEWYGARTLEGQAKYDYLNRAPPYGVFPDSTEPYWRQDKNGEWFVGPEDGKKYELKMGMKPGITAAAGRHGSAETTELRAMAKQLQAYKAEMKRLQAERVQFRKHVAGQERELELQKAEWVGKLEKFREQAKERNSSQNKQRADLSAENAALKAALEMEKGKHTAALVEETVGDTVGEQIAGYERKLEVQEAAWVGKMEEFRNQAKKRNRIQNQRFNSLEADNAALKAALEMEKGKLTAAVEEENNAEAHLAVVKNE
ncbi:hypothetical protein LTS10_005273 [Elasticomyces elasticus]|nr:hypothetical protein LTS10_005273 [Elasticomyces elasticus]